MRGLWMLEQSIKNDGIGDGITITADGETISGAARLEKLSEIMPDVKIVEIETDGNTLIINKRVDIPNIDDPRAQRLSVAHNRVPQVDLDWDIDVLNHFSENNPDCLTDLFFENELLKMNGDNEYREDNPNELWEGMPEFENEPKAYKSIHVHFKDQQAVEEFQNIIGFVISGKTMSFWYPPKDRRNTKDLVYITEDDSNES